MAEKWIFWWSMLAIFVLCEIAGVYWACLPDQRGQAMPAMILPMLAGLVGFAVLFILWVICRFL